MNGSFLGRESELAVLEREYINDSSFVLLTGRRRIGKTRLIREFIKNKDSLYFFAGRENDHMMLKSFSDTVSRYLGISVEFTTWAGAFESLVNTGRKVVVAIDEFQNMVYSDVSIISSLQHIWDSILFDSRIMLIVCGSHVSVMNGLADDYEGPLYGRFTRHMTLGPLPFDAVRGDDYVESVRSYAIHGGVPKYMESLGDGDLEESMLNNILDSSSMLFDDPLVSMSDEVRDPAGYMSILMAISCGNHRITDISSALKVPVTSLARPLDNLISMRLVRRDIPVTEQEGRSRRGLYVFADNFTAFWFSFVNPFMSALQIGEKDGAMEYWRAHFSEHHASFVFEEICRRSAYRMADVLGFTPIKVGRYWDKNVEADVVALDTDGKKAFVAECKFRSSKPVGMHELSALETKCKDIKALKDYEIVFGLFSVTGFEDSLYETDTILIDKGKIVNNSGTGRVHDAAG